MKRWMALFLAALLLCTAAAFADETPSDTLVVVFSHAGENYNVGVVEEGNTMKLARIIAEQTGADLFEIEPAVPYPESYEDCLDIATAELRSDARPEFLGEVENWERYETVFVGYPIWWGHLPQILYTFLEAYDWTGKTLVPFNTHEGSRQAGTWREIEEAAPGATVLQGLAVVGSTAQNDPETTSASVSAWLADLGLGE